MLDFVVFFVLFVPAMEALRSVNVLKALKPQQKFIFTGGITALIGSYFVYNGFLGKHKKNTKHFYCRKAKNCNSRKCKWNSQKAWSDKASLTRWRSRSKSNIGVKLPTIFTSCYRCLLSITVSKLWRKNTNKRCLLSIQTRTKILTRQKFSWKFSKQKRSFKTQISNMHMMSSDKPTSSKRRLSRKVCSILRRWVRKRRWILTGI